MFLLVSQLEKEYKNVKELAIFHLFHFSFFFPSLFFLCISVAAPILLFKWGTQPSTDSYRLDQPYYLLSFSKLQTLKWSSSSDCSIDRFDRSHPRSTCTLIPPLPPPHFLHKKKRRLSLETVSYYFLVVEERKKAKRLGKRWASAVDFFSMSSTSVIAVCGGGAMLQVSTISDPPWLCARHESTI